MMESWVEWDNQITLEEIRVKLLLEHNIQASTSTIHRMLDERIFTYKNVHHEPLQMNDPQFKQMRQEYVRRLRAMLGEGKLPIWIDETNYNLFTARTKARSKRGTRAVNQRGSSQKEKNLHIIGAISTNNFLYCTAKRGAYKGQHANDWLRDMLRQAKAHFGALGDLLVICDNAPCHSRLGNVLDEEEFGDVSLLRLSPYSPMMNPIENLWSMMKNHVKSLLRERLAAFMGPAPDGQTRDEFRLSYLEHVAHEVIAGVDVNRLHRLSLRLEHFYTIAENLGNMEVGT
ncbi:hypothetical protein AeMF1_020253 [Aphanomyces euteiches]|nr:hypothetical protein AeMF1_020253 [Aphanomyces euteiches]